MSKSLHSWFMFEDAKMPVIFLELVDEPFIIQFALPCRDNASRRDTGYAERIEDLVGVAVEAGRVAVEFERVVVL